MSTRCVKGIHNYVPDYLSRMIDSTTLENNMYRKNPNFRLNHAPLMTPTNMPVNAVNEAVKNAVMFMNVKNGELSDVNAPHRIECRVKTKRDGVIPQTCYVYNTPHVLIALRRSARLLAKRRKEHDYV